MGLTATMPCLFSSSWLWQKLCKPEGILNSKQQPKTTSPTRPTHWLGGPLSPRLYWILAAAPQFSSPATRCTGTINQLPSTQGVSCPPPTHMDTFCSHATPLQLHPLTRSRHAPAKASAHNHPLLPGHEIKEKRYPAACLLPLPTDKGWHIRVEGAVT